MPRRKISVLILHNSPQPSTDQAFAESEAGVLAEVEAVSRALDKLRIPHRAVGVRQFEELPGVLSASDETVVFNLVEGFWTNPKQCNLVSNVVRSFGKACTGNDAYGLLLSLDKWQCKALLAAAGIPTPQGLIVPPGRPVPTRGLFAGPYIVKPVETDASEGIDKTSIIPGPGKALRQAVQRIHDQMGQPALIEQFIDGRELNISVISRKGELEVLPLAEIDFSAFEAGRPRIVGYEAKWLEDSFEYHHTPRIIPAPLPKRVAERVRELAAASCRALSCFEYCRVDFRLDKANRPYVLEVNANPDISLDAGFAAAIKAAGMSYQAFVKLEIDNAVRRSSVRWELPRSDSRGKRPPYNWRPSTDNDRYSLVRAGGSPNRPVLPCGDGLLPPRRDRHRARADRFRDRRRTQGTLPVLRRSRERPNRRLGVLGPDALHARHVRHLLARRSVQPAGPGHRPDADEFRRALDCRAAVANSSSSRPPAGRPTPRRVASTRPWAIGKRAAFPTSTAPATTASSSSRRPRTRRPSTNDPRLEYRVYAGRTGLSRLQGGTPNRRVRKIVRVLSPLHSRLSSASHHLERAGGALPRDIALPGACRS